MPRPSVSASEDVTDGIIELNTSRRPVVIAAYVVAIGLTVAAIASTWVAAAFTDKQIEMATDYATFHGAALLVTEGNGPDMYDGDILIERIAVATGSAKKTSDSFHHFPFFALFFVPLTVLPFATAYVVFLAAGVIALAAMLSKVGMKRIGLVLGLIAVSLPGFWTLHLGQMGFLVSALLLGVFLALRSGRTFVAGLLLGLLFFKFPYAVGIGVWWLLRAVHFRAAIAGAALSAIVLSLAGFAIPGGWEGYLDLISDGLISVDVSVSGFSILEMWVVMLPNDGLAAALWAASAVPILVGFAVVVRRLEHRLEPSLALAVVVGLLISPRTGWYDWMLLVVPGVLFWETYPRLRPQLVVAGAWLFPAGALSWLLATRINDATGFFFQLAPVVLAGVAVWWVRLLLAEVAAREPAGVG